ncbi:hypothetical protein M758_2G120100 [Ceratodon purpureus]|nr:hypothetical protein M758_2G120100 [Ceratodon purpureus]
MGSSSYRHLRLQALVFCNFIAICISSSFDLRSSPYERLQPSPLAAPHAVPFAPDVITLLALKEALDNPSNPTLSTWNISTPLCAWRGVAWSHEGSFPFNCEWESYTLTYTYATDLGAVATSLALPSAGLNGTLSPVIAQLYELKVLALGGNKLTGSIPGELGNSPSLTVVSLEQNHLTGPIPASIWNLCRNTKLTALLLHGNNLSGPIPEPLGGSGTTCSQLVSLTLANNELSGFIPPFIGNFANLSWLDLSYNKFTYVIPVSFANLKNLSTKLDNGFNVAGNHLMGPIPHFKESFDPRVFEGNSPWLCGPPLTTPCLHTPTTLTTHQHHRGAMNPTAIMLLISAVAVCIVLFFYAIYHLTTLSMLKLLLKKMHLLPGEKAINEEAKFPQGKLVQFYEGGGGALTEETVLKSASELLEETSYGKNYRVWLPSKHMLSLSLFKDDITRDEPEFLQGILRLAVIKHSNLVSLRAYYLSRKNEKLLIYDHVIGKSLADIIHGECTLNWQQRHNLALRIAHGLAHLHLEPSVPLVHANLKSSNIFVDGNYNAVLTGYGLHLLVTPAAVNGIIVDANDEGCIAPELRKSKKISTHIDVFSYGIVLLEILTGRTPGKVSRNDTTVVLQELVKAAIVEERLHDVLDLELLKPSICTPTENGLLEALKLAMSCCAPSPSLRPPISEVVQTLEEIQSKFLTQDPDSNRTSCEL